jgi:hypothetical protein
VLVLALVGLALDHHCRMGVPMAVVVIGTVGALLGSHGRFLSQKANQRKALGRP